MPQRHAIGVGAWGLVAIGALSGRVRMLPPPPVAAALIAGLALLATLTALSLAWSPSLERTGEELARVAGYGGIVALFLLFADRRFWQPLSAAALIAGVAVCALGVFAALLPEGFAGLGSRDRLGHPFDYPNALAAWSAMTLVMGLAWSAAARTRTVRSLALAALPVAGTSLYLTYSRAGLLIALAGLALVIALSGARRRALAHTGILVALTALTGPLVAELIDLGSGVNRNVAAALVLVVAAAAAAAAAPRWTAGPSFRQRSGQEGASPSVVIPAVAAFVVLSMLGHAALSSGEQPAATKGAVGERLLSPSSARSVEWAAALDAFAEKPVQGLGAGTYAFWWLTSGEREIAVQDAHSLYLEQLAELGGGGLVAISLVVGGMLWLALAPLRAGERAPPAVAMPAAVACFAAFAAVDWLWESTAVTVLALGCALSAGAYAAGAQPHPSGQRRREAPHAGGRSRHVIGVVAIALALAQVPGLIGGLGLSSANRALQQGDVSTAIERAGRARAAMPWAATPYASRARAHLAAGEDRRALRDAVKATEREQLDYRHWLLLSRARSGLRDITGSLDALARARALGYRLSPGVPAEGGQ